MKIHATGRLSTDGGSFSAANCRRWTAALLTVAALWFGMPPAWAADPASEVVEHESGFYYTVRKGDTLWDLSQKFSDSPWLWPELWGENKQITNPHWIYPGDRIRLLHKDWLEHEHIVPEAAPATEAAPAPVQPQPEDAYFLYTPIDAVGFIRQAAAPATGTIIRVQDNKTMLAQGDLVYIRPESGPAVMVGQRYTIYRTSGKVQDPVSEDVVGIQHLLVGIVEITELHDSYALGRIHRSFREIHIGDQLMPFQPRSPKIALTGTVPGLKGHIIVAENRQALIGDFAVAFLNKGSDDGVQIGQQYLVYHQGKERIRAEDKDLTLLPPIDFARVLVLHSEPTTATVLVTQADRTVHAGDLVRAP